ncbi:MAG: DUF3021 domain-containing protein [Clostridiales bacterium]|nr:DUF3021 domain-containing protein [Clostridiales bacterium]
MKKYVLEAMKRGMLAAWGGPVILAIIYAILGANGVVESLTVREVCLGIISLEAMAFIVAGVSVVYQVERLPLPMAILIQAGVLYLDYLLVYLMNGWLKNQLAPVMIFTVVFFIGFGLIWLIISQIIKRQIKQVNSKMRAQ